jgi:hypothetical protein
MYKSAVYIYHCGVINKPASFPSAAAKTIAVITKAIINTAIKSYFGSPIASVKSVIAVFITPIWRGP